MILHAGLVAFPANGRWRGVLIEGPSAAGKSDLALRCLDLGARLVADDRVIVWTSAGSLWGRAPESLAGLIEIRGVGIVRQTPLAMAPIALVIACQPGPEAIERLPEEAFVDRLNVRVPLRPLWPFEPAAPIKLRRLLERL